MNLRSNEIQEASKRFILFAKAVFPSLVLTPFHLKYYRVLHLFATGKIKRLIITVPPQHGKSQGSSILLPAFMLGINPDLKIAIASYSATLATKFNKRIQRIIDTPLYGEIFPKTAIKSKGSSTEHARTSDYVEVIERMGELTSVGREGSLTGNQVDVFILDDLYKDAMEANSPVVRENCWDWYTSVVKTRQHNDSQELIVFTRWHEEDLIGKMEETSNVIELESFSQVDPNFDGYYKVNFEAIKESDPTELDPRNIGEPLWPERHSLKTLNEKRNLDRHTFDCLYQGHPSSKEGVLYGNSFQIYDSLPENPIKYANYTDTADTGSDKLCSVCYVVGKDGLIYITDVLYTSEPMEVTEKSTADMISRNNVRIALIESNNGGRGFARAVQKYIPSVKVEWFHQSGNKEARILSNSATVLQNIRMPFDWRLRWPEFFSDLTSYKRVFRANKHDDAPDVLTGIVEKEIAEKHKPIDESEILKSFR